MDFYLRLRRFYLNETHTLVDLTTEWGGSYVPTGRGAGIKRNNTHWEKLLRRTLWCGTQLVVWPRRHPALEGWSAKDLRASMRYEAPRSVHMHVYMPFDYFIGTFETLVESSIFSYLLLFPSLDLMQIYTSPIKFPFLKHFCILVSKC